ncbi:MAG: NAD(P)-dependent oxidoreductase [Planctomycetota bacterium]|nr:NAD(P)-dependent oxidoreductase [Planctomycetota bacterium]
MSHPPLVIYTETLDPAALAWLSSRAEVRQGAPEDAAFEAAAPTAEGLVVRTYTRVDDELLDRLPALKVVARAGVGIDNIDVAACRARGVEVVYAPASSTHAVAEYVLALLCDALRPRDYLDGAADRATWSGLRRDLVATRQFDELTLGILGLGRIGGTVAGFARALGFEVLYHDLRTIPESSRSGATPVGCEELFERSDVLTVHVDGRAGNRGVIGRGLLDRLPEGAVLLNTSRGFVFDGEGLRGWLAARGDARAYLDVHDPEPPPAGDPLLALPNAFLLPHLASRTSTAMARMSDVVHDVWAVLEGRAPEWPAPDP